MTGGESGAYTTGFGERSSSTVWIPQVPFLTVMIRVPGLRPLRTSLTSSPPAIRRARVASMSATRQLRPQRRS